MQQRIEWSIGFLQLLLFIGEMTLVEILGTGFLVCVACRLVVGTLIFMKVLQVAASTNKELNGHIPSYPGLPPQLICQLHNVTMDVSFTLFIVFVVTIICFGVSSVGRDWRISKLQADVETDEVYAQMTLQPLTPVCYIYQFIRFVSKLFVSANWLFLHSKSKKMCAFYQLNLGP